eukprot:9811400-Alexandrium_andersonii.AAC.1
MGHCPLAKHMGGTAVAALVLLTGRNTHAILVHPALAKVRGREDSVGQATTSIRPLGRRSRAALNTEQRARPGRFSQRGGSGVRHSRRAGRASSAQAPEQRVSGERRQAA